MSTAELLLIAVGLSMDAFAVSICKGLSLQKISVRSMLLAGIWFGGFQALMPAIGYFAGSLFSGFVEKYAHWIAFFLLAWIGGNMIREALKGDEEEVSDSMRPGEMLMLAVATSIDALAVGASFAFLQVQLLSSVLIIGCTTFLISAAGVWIGSIFGTRFKRSSQIAGGIILIGIGLKLLLEGLLA